MASDVSALSGIVANGHQVLPTFPPPPLSIPYGEFSPVRLVRQRLVELAAQNQDIEACNPAALEGALVLDRMEEEDASAHSR
jgi:hypothetical protein